MAAKEITPKGFFWALDPAQNPLTQENAGGKAIAVNSLGSPNSQHFSTFSQLYSVAFIRNFCVTVFSCSDLLLTFSSTRLLTMFITKKEDGYEETILQRIDNPNPEGSRGRRSIQRTVL